MSRSSIGKFALLVAASLALPSSSEAGTAYSEPKEVVEQVKESFITGDLGVNVVSQYISRGLIFENQGAIIQPYADLYFKLYEGEGFLNKISLNLGIWNSFHENKTDAGLVSGGSSSTRSWYEFDFTAGLSFTFAKNFVLTPSYFTFLSPNDGFATFQGLNIKLAYDDSDLFGGFALHPYVQVLFELENKAGNGPDEGIYYEVGIAPSVPLGPVTLAFPIYAGFGSNEFYADDEAYGFFSAGMTVSYALTFMPEGYGTWTLTAGGAYYHLGSALESFNPGVRDTEDGEHEFVWSGGLSVAF